MNFDRNNWDSFSLEDLMRWRRCGDLGERKIKTQRLIGKRFETVAHVKGLSALYLLGIAAIQNVEHHSRDPKIMRHAKRSPYGVGHQKPAIALALMTLIDADHGYERNGNLTASRLRAGVTGGKRPIIDCSGIQPVKAEDVGRTRCQNEDPQIAGLSKLPGGLSQKIVNLLDTGRETFTIMMVGIKRLDDDTASHFTRGHRLVTVR